MPTNEDEVESMIKTAEGDSGSSGSDSSGSGGAPAAETSSASASKIDVKELTTEERKALRKALENYKD